MCRHCRGTLTGLNETSIETGESSVFHQVDNPHILQNMIQFKEMPE